MSVFVITPRRDSRPRWSVEEVFANGNRDILARFDSETAALAYRRELQRGADKAELSTPLHVPKPEAHRKRWTDGSAVVLIAASLAWATPAAAQHSSLFMCLQQAPAGTADQMLAGCQEQVREWMTDCGRMRNADVCVGAIHEEASLASQQRRRP